MNTNIPHIMTSDEPQLRFIDSALHDLLQRQFPQAPVEHCELAALLSYQLNQGHLCLPLAALESAAKGLGLQITLGDLVNKSEVFSHTANTPVVLDAEHLYLHRYWQLEKNISERILASIRTENLNPADIAPVLAKLFPASDDKALATDESNWQKIACLLAARQKFSVITGGPGTGKTTTVIKLLALLQTLNFQQTGKYLSVQLAAPTGKAAARLSESINGALQTIKQLGFSDDLIAQLPAQASTLHRLLGRKAKTRHFKHNQSNPITAELLVVDEASMIDIDMMLALLDALPQSSRLILVGDKDQLASVEAGAVMSELCRDADELNYSAETISFIQQCGVELKADAQLGNNTSMFAQAMGKLQKCWRAESLSIIDLAKAINQQNIETSNQVLASNPNELFRITQNEQWIEKQLFEGEFGLKTLFQTIQQAINSHFTYDELAKTALKTLAKQQLLSPLRQGTSGVNSLNESIRVKAFALAKSLGLTDVRQVHDVEFFIGEPILVTKNLYDLGVMNGDIGIVLPYEQSKQLRVAFADAKQGIRWIIPEQLEGNSQGAYAITVHQSQGSEYDRVLLYMPSQENPVLTKELIYTAVTRAKKQFVLLEHEENSAVFNQAIKAKTTRYSALAKRLYGR